MRILQINSDYRYSSTGKITESLHNMLTQSGVDSFVFYGRNLGQTQNDIRVQSFISVRASKAEHLLCNIVSDPYGCCFLSTNQIIKQLEKLKPDVVHLQCINGYFVNIYRLLNYLGERKIKTILTLHAEYIYTGGCDHAFECREWLNGCKNCNGVNNCTIKRKSPIVYDNLLKSFSHFRENDLLIVSVSDWMKSRAMQSPILNRFKHITILNGVDTSIFYHRNLGVARKHTIELVHVTTGFYPESEDNKGGRYIVDIANELLQRKIDFQITIAASHGAFSTSLPPGVKYVGKVNNQEELAKLYSAADATLIVSKRESFGMAVAESLCCGTKVFGFKAGGPESIAIPKYCTFVNYGNVVKLVDELVELSSNTNYDKVSISQSAYDIYSQERLCAEYIKAYDLILGGR